MSDTGAIARNQSATWTEVVLVPAERSLEPESRLRSAFAHPAPSPAELARRKRSRRRRAVLWWFFDLWGYVAVTFFALLLIGLLFAFVAAFTGRLK